MDNHFPRRQMVCEDLLELEGGFEPAEKRHARRKSVDGKSSEVGNARLIAALHKVICLYAQQCHESIWARMDFQGARMQGVVLEVGIAVTEVDMPFAQMAWQHAAPRLRRDLSRQVRRKKVPVIRAVWLLQWDVPEEVSEDTSGEGHLAE